MSLIGQPLVFISNGSKGSVAAIPNILTFAERLGSPTSMVLKLQGRMDDTIFQKRVAEAYEFFAEYLGRLTLHPVRHSHVHTTLNEITHSAGGMLALLPSRRRGLGRLFTNNDYERYLIDGPLPVLALGPGGEIGDIKRVLFAADYSPRSDTAFAQTTELCLHLGAELHILHVYGQDGLLPSEQDLARRKAATDPKQLFDIDQEKLYQMRDSATAAGLNVNAAITEGRAHAAILDYAAEIQADLIVTATHGPRNQEDIFQGTTSSRIILKSRIPVLAYRA